jgi:hypothetical protein
MLTYYGYGGVGCGGETKGREPVGRNEASAKRSGACARPDKGPIFGPDLFLAAYNSRTLGALLGGYRGGKVAFANRMNPTSRPAVDDGEIGAVLGQLLASG